MALVVAVSGIGVASAGDAEEAVALLDRLNDRWVGATATMRVSISLKDDADRDGWFESRWMMHEPVTDSDQRFLLKARISDRGPIGHHIADDTLLSGARFRTLGWRYEDPDRAKGLKLELEFIDAPVRMEWRFTRRGFSLAAEIEADELAHIERYMRLEAYDLQAAEERLVALAPTTPPTARAPTPTPTAIVVRPEVSQVVAEVVPSRVRPGNWVRLVVGYDVSGLLPGEVREVVEIRRLAAGGVPLETFEHREQRPAGRVTSELPVKVPYDAAPGVYSVGTTLRLAGAATHSTTAVFLVTTEGEFR